MINTIVESIAKYQDNYELGSSVVVKRCHRCKKRRFLIDYDRDIGACDGSHDCHNSLCNECREKEGAKGVCTLCKRYICGEGHCFYNTYDECYKCGMIVCDHCQWNEGENIKCDECGNMYCIECYHNVTIFQKGSAKHV